MQNDHAAVYSAGDGRNRRIEPDLLLDNEETDPEPDKGDHQNEVEKF